MAILHDLLVSGSSRLLNKLYVSSGIDNTGNVNILNGGLTIRGTYDNHSATGQLTLYDTSGLGLIIRNDTANTYFLVTKSNTENAYNTLRPMQINMSSGLVSFNHGISVTNVSGGTATFSGLTTHNGGITVNGTTATTSLTASTGLFTNCQVLDTLRTTKWSIDNVASLGGHFYVAPTILFSSSTTATISAISGTTVTMAIKDSNSIKSNSAGGATWSSGAKVKLSGRLGNVALGTCTGTLTTAMNATAGTITLTFTFDNASSLSVKSYAASEIHNLAIMMYNNGTYPVGIAMTSYGTNQYSYIDIYGGSKAANDPNVRIGKLDGLPAINGTSPTGWGIYTNNGFFNGTIVSTAGKIGGYTLSTYNLIGNNVGISSQSGYEFAFWAGSNTSSSAPFRVGHEGTLYCTQLSATGGTIGSFKITGEYLCSNPDKVGLSATNANWAFYAGYNSSTQTAPFRVTNSGTLYCTDIQATGGTIGGCSITNGKLTVPAANISGALTVGQLPHLEVGGRNLISGTSTDEISLGGFPSSNYSEGKTYKTISIPTKNEYVLSFDAKSTVNGDTIVCHFYSPNTTIKCETSTGYTRDGNTDGYVELTMTNSWKRYWVKYTQNGANTTAVKNLIIGRRQSGNGSGSISIRSIKFEEGHVPTAWSPAPEDVSSLISTAQSTANTANSAAATAQSTANSANSLASTANSTANSALSTANSAITKLTLQDTRNDNQNPNWYMSNYPKTVVREFKGCSSIGLSVTSTYCTLETKVPWVDSSGGYPTQVATVGNDNKVYKRVGTSGTTWSAWVSADQIIANWCYNNDTTYINGGKIYTGSISTNQLAANCVTAAKINVSDLFAQTISATGKITASNLHITGGAVVGSLVTTGISASNITTGTLSADRIAAGSIGAGKLSVTSLSAISANLGSVTAGEINIGSGKFTVSSSGVMSCQGASINGAVTATSITANTCYSIYTGSNSTRFIYYDAPELRIGLPTNTTGDLSDLAAGFSFHGSGSTTCWGNLTASSSFTSPYITATVDMTCAGSMSVGSTFHIAATNAVDLSNSSAAFVLGTKNGQHLEMDDNRIQAKANATTDRAIHLNPFGGNLHVNYNYGETNGGRLAFGSSGGASVIASNSNILIKGSKFSASYPGSITLRSSGYWKSSSDYLNGTVQLQDANTNTWIHLAYDATKPYFASKAIYNRTTSSGSAVRIDSSGLLLRYSSASKYKTDIEPITDGSYAYNVLKINPKTWYDKSEIESYANALTKEIEGKNPTEVYANYNHVSLERVHGLVAEDVEAAGLGKYCIYEVDAEKNTKELEGINYEKVTTLLIPIVRDLVLYTQKTAKYIHAEEITDDDRGEIATLLSRINSFKEEEVIV